MVKSNKQKGGRISMPSEYYGVESKRYSKTPKKMNCGKPLFGGKKTKKSLKQKKSLKLKKSLKGGNKTLKNVLRNLLKKLN